MISMQTFVSRIRSFDRRPKLSFIDCYETASHRGSAAVTRWDVEEMTRTTLYYLENSPLVAVTYLDGSAQLLSRDEDECLLFATLWELER